MIKKQIRTSLMLLLISMVAVLPWFQPGAHAGDSESVSKGIKLTAEEKAWITDHPVIRLGVDPEFAPFESFSKDGKYIGLAADYVHLIGDRLGIRFMAEKGLSWKEAVARAKAGKIDALPCVGITEARKQYFKYSEPYLTFPRVIITRNDASIKSLDDLSQGVVTVQRNSSHHGFIKENTKLSPLLFDTFEQALMTVSSGKADATLGNLAVATHSIGKHQLTNLKIAGFASMEYFPLAFAVRKEMQPLVPLINKALDSITEQESLQIIRQWVPVQYAPEIQPLDSERNRVSLTPEEQAWIRENPEVRLGYDPAWPPFEWRDRGAYVGLAQEFVRHIEKTTGLGIKALPDLSWQQVMAGLKDGSVDMASCLTRSPQRLTFLDFTRPYIAYPAVFMVRKGTERKAGLDAYAGLKVGTGKGYIFEEFLKTHHPDVDLVLYDAPEDGLWALSVGDIDAYVGNLAVLSFFMEKNSLSNLEVGGQVKEMGKMELRMAARKDEPLLASILDKALAAIPVETHQRIVRNWVGANGTTTVDTQLTEAEKVWIKAHPVVRSSIADSPPNHFWADGPKGVSIDILNRIGAKYGFKVEFVKYPTWTEAKEALKNHNRIDVVPIVPVGNREYQKIMAFSKDYLKDPLVIYAKKDVADIFSLKDLVGKTVAVPRGYTVQKVLAKEYPKIKQLLTDTRLEGLLAVSEGRADAYVGNLAIGRYLIMHANISNLKMAAPAGLKDQRFAFGVRDDWKIFASILNKGLASIPTEEQVAIHAKYFEINPNAQRINYTLLLWVFVGLGSVILFIIAWNRTLRRKVAAGTEEIRKYSEQLEERVEERTAEIGEAKEHLQEVFDSAPICMMLVDRNVRIRKINRTGADMTGKSAGDAVDRLGGEAFNCIAPIEEMSTCGQTPKCTSCSVRSAVEETFDTQKPIVRREGHLTISADGRPTTLFLIISTRLLHEAGDLLALVSIDDVTERKRAEEALRESENRLRIILDSVQTGIVIIDPRDFAIVQVNVAALNMIGAPEEQVVGRVCHNFMRPAEKGQCPVKHLGKSTDSEQRVLLTADGVETPIMKTVNKIILDGKEYFLESFVDITELEQTRKEMEKSRESLANAQRIAQMGNWDWDLKTGNMVWSDETLIIYGLVRGEVPMHIDSFFDIVHPEDKAMLQEAIAEGIETLEPQNVEHRILLPDGTVRIVSQKGEVTCDASGNPVQLSGTIQDVTEMRKTQNELAEAEERGRMLLEAAGEGIFGVDSHGRLTFANPVAMALLGYKTEELLGKKVHGLIHHSYENGENYPVAECPMCKAYTQGIKGEVEDEVLWRKDGASFPVHYKSVPIIKDGTIFGAVVTFSDISERREAEKVILESKEAAEAANRAKSEFLANMSHEIRTPMNAILGMTHLALQTELTDQQQDYLHKTHGSAEKLLGIINDILDFSKIEAGKLDMEEVRFNLDDVLNGTMDVVGVKTEEKGLGLRLDIPPDVPRTLMGDPLRLNQILINLANNAVKFTAQGDIIMSAHIEWVKKGQACLKFSVQDSGIGMTAEQCANLFKPFSQADSSTTRKYGGTGLGLSISKQLAELMNGEIWVESEEGVGSTFFFTAVFGRFEGQMEKRPHARPDLHDDDTSPLKGARILLAEDNEINQQIAMEFLEQVGVRVHLAENGEEAVRAVQEKAFDLVLMDIQMPVLDGYAATRKIREMEQFKDLPIIAMTAHAMSSDAEKSINVGMNDHVTKPIRPQVLYATLLRFLGTDGGEIPGARVASHDDAVLSNHEEFADLAGIDGATGLSFMGGNKRLYKNVLRQFVRNYSGVWEQMNEAVLKNDLEVAERIAHSVKGVSGNMGANALNEIAAKVEMGFREGNTHTWTEFQASFKEEVHQIVQSLHRAGFVQDEPVVSVQEKGDVQPKLSKEIVSALMEALEGGYSDRLPELVKRVTEIDENMGKKIGKMVEDYEYDQLLVMLGKKEDEA